MNWIKDIDGGIELSVRVIPRSSKNAVAGKSEDALRVKLRAPPVDGKANSELICFISDFLGVPRRSVSILAGDRSRIKRLFVKDIKSEQVLEKLAAL